MMRDYGVVPQLQKSFLAEKKSAELHISPQGLAAHSGTVERKPRPQGEFRANWIMCIRRPFCVM